MSTVAGYQIDYCKSFNRVLLFKVVLTILGPLSFPVSVKTSLSASAENVFEIH